MFQCEFASLSYASWASDYRRLLELKSPRHSGSPLEGFCLKRLFVKRFEGFLEKIVWVWDHIVYVTSMDRSWSPSGFHLSSEDSPLVVHEEIVFIFLFLHVRVERLHVTLKSLLALFGVEICWRWRQVLTMVPSWFEPSCVGLNYFLIVGPGEDVYPGDLSIR